MDKSNKTRLKPGDEVGWQWVSGLATGVVISVHKERTEIISKGSTIVRKGSSDNPAVLISHRNGNQVLKLASELQRIS